MQLWDSWDSPLVYRLLPAMAAFARPCHVARALYQPCPSAVATLPLAEAECYSDVDRAAIMELIGEWFADGSREVTSTPLQEVGIHNFETFVRMTCMQRYSLDLGSGGSSQWSAEHMLLTLHAFRRSVVL